MSTPQQVTNPKWMSAVLVIAGIYNLLWGSWVVLQPLAFFEWAKLAPPNYLQIWQCVGMVVGVYGLGYLIASSDPIRHWPIVFVGLLGKILGPIGFVSAAIQQTLSWTWAWIIVFNDLIWWIPFAGILYQTIRFASNSSASTEGLRQRLSFDEAIHNVRSHRGTTLAQLSKERPTLVVFLRHTGCTFCRESVDDIARQRSKIEALGVQIAIIHMSDPMQATRMMSKSKLDDVHRYSDPYCALYEAFGLERGSLGQLFGFHVFWRGLVAGFVKGHGIGTLEGDGFRMPGVFLLDHGRIVSSYRAVTAADRPNYIDLASHPDAEGVCTVPLRGVAS